EHIGASFFAHAAPRGGEHGDLYLAACTVARRRIELAHDLLVALAVARVLGELALTGHIAAAAALQLGLLLVALRLLTQCPCSLCFCDLRFRRRAHRHVFRR